MQLVFEDQASLPAESADNFVEFEQDGKTVFMHKDLAESKKANYRTQGQLTKLTNQFGDVKNSLSTLQQEQDERLAAAASEAEQAAINKFKEENNIDGLMQIQAEKFENTIKTLQTELNTERDGRVALEGSILDGKKDSLAVKIASAYAAPQFAESVAELLKTKRMKALDGELAFTNASGEAVELDIDVIIGELSHDKFFQPFAKAPSSKPGYNTNGGGGGGNSKVMNRKDFERMHPSEQAKFVRGGGRIA